MTHSFRDLHARGNPFVLANVWDKGTACLLAGLGAQALATSSGAHAFTLGRADLGMAMATATHTTLHSLSTAMFGQGDFSALANNLSYETIDDCVTKGRMA